MTLTISLVESTSEQPTRTQDTILDDPQITPGGLDPANNVPTLGKMRGGSMVAKVVVAIEGCKHLLSDAPAASVAAAWAGTDFAEADVLGGVFVELSNTHSISPDDPFASGGRCVIRVMDDSPDHADTFGLYVHKRNAGDKTTLSLTADRNDTTLTVRRTADFPSSGTAYVGTEAIGYTGTSVGAFTGVTRGKFSPFGCDSSGSGGSRFARHHRVSYDVNTTLSNPVVTDVPRNWMGKGVAVYLHTWDEATQQLNTRARAQLIYVGRIVGIADDADTMSTVIDVEHIAEDFKRGVVGKDLLAADVAPGIRIVAGRKFQYSDTVFSSPAAGGNASDLNVVASGASGAYQMNEGFYTGDELAGILSRWLAQAKTDAAIAGYISVGYAVSAGNVGLRSKIWYRFESASTVNASFGMTMPGEVAAFFGFSDGESSPIGQSVNVSKQDKTNKSGIKQGDYVPFHTMVFKPLGPGRTGNEFATTSLSYELENVRGTFVSQYGFLPASIKASAPAGTDWGIFLLDDKVLMVASYQVVAGPPYEVSIRNAWIAPFQLAADNSTDALGYLGRRIDEPPAAVTLRQVLILEGQFKDIVNRIVYSTGATGYNHGTYDVFGAGVGIGIPGSLLGPEWERSLENLPCADSPIAVVIDEPTKFADLFRDDFMLRRAFVRWHDQGFEFGTWRTPLVALAEHELTESNKAAPADASENHRIASQETDQWHYPTVKIDYSRDFGGSRSATYLKSIQIEDQAGTDGSGNTGRTLNLKMRNTFAQYAQAGAAVEELIKEYMAGLPMFSRPSRMISRSIDMRYFETVAVGDICTITDLFARDPLTGVRGITSRAGIVTRISYDLGGPRPDGGVRPMYGEIELFFLDTQRGGVYAPAAEVHDLINYGGYAAGYNATTKQLWLKRTAYAFGAVINTIRGPITYTTERDARSFVVGDKITIVERDPANTASPTTWNDTIAAIDGDVLTLTTGLAGWSATKLYRVIPQAYGSVTARQQDYVYQADYLDEMIVDTEIADQYSSAVETVAFTPTASTEKAELVADLTWGDGKALDVGTDAALARSINAFIDYKSAHQAPFLWENVLGPVDETSTEWACFFFGPVYCGTEHLSSTVTRVLRVAPWFRSRTGSTGKIRVTICSVVPTQPPGGNRYLPGEQFRDAMFSDRFSQSTEWSTTSTTWQTGAAVDLNLNCKDLQWGYVWLIVQGTGYVQCRGLAQLTEGARRVGA
jgi:hypothetical protein